jgi:hypothetical protein
VTLWVTSGTVLSSLNIIYLQNIVAVRWKCIQFPTKWLTVVPIVGNVGNTTGKFVGAGVYN